MPYRIANSVTNNGEEVFVAASNSFYYQYTIDGGFVELAQNTERLSDTNPILCRFNQNNETLLLAYSNSVIDLIKEDKVLKLDGIAKNNFYVNKAINEIHFIENRAYLSCGFGITIVDLDSGLFLDDFPIGENGATIPVNDIVDDGTLLYAATDEGLISIEKDNAFIDNFNNWTRYGNDDPEFAEPFQELCIFKGQVYASSGTSLYVWDDEWTLIYDTTDWDIKKMSPGVNKLIISEYQMDGASIVDTRVN